MPGPRQDYAVGGVQVGTDMEEFPRLHLTPVGIVVQAFAGDDDGRVVGQVLGVDAHAPVAAAVIEMPAAVLAARRTLEDI